MANYEYTVGGGGSRNPYIPKAKKQRHKVDGIQLEKEEELKPQRL